MRQSHTLSIMLAALLALASGSARAESPEIAQAKAYFKAGAAAYELGDYQAAIQALEAAYRLTPLPAIAFSLAQAERRQYFVSKERAHLERAIALFNGYLADVKTGGRRADATDALSQLEPLALSATKPEAAESAVAAAAKTRLMITCATPGALVAIDQAPAEKPPLIAEVAPGEHHLRVSAPGFYPNERSVAAVAGEFVPIEITLREQPAVLRLHATPEAELHVDGSYLGDVSYERKLELQSGVHRLSFAKAGYHVQTIDTRLAPGEQKQIEARLHPTEQRVAAIVLFVASGVALTGSVIVTAVALDRENAAKRFLTQRETGNVSASELAAYRHAVEQRDRMRAIAVGGFVVSAAALVTGLFLYALDQPRLIEPTARPAGPRLEAQVSLPLSAAKSGLSIGAKLRF